MIIGLCGFAGSGKDAICTALGFHRVAFADALKADLAPILAKLPPHEKSQARELFVAYGVARKVDPDYWLITIEFTRFENVCFTDVRYLNEAHFVLSLGGTLFRIHRPGIAAANDEENSSIHQLATALSGQLWPIDNDGTVKDAAKRIRSLWRCGA